MGYSSKKGDKAIIQTSVNLLVWYKFGKGDEEAPIN